MTTAGTETRHSTPGLRVLVCVLQMGGPPLAHPASYSRLAATLASPPTP